MSNNPRTILVTVGSTLFTALTGIILSPDALSALASLGVRHLIVQYGAADIQASTVNGLSLDSAGTGEGTWFSPDGSREVVVRVMRYSDDFEGLVKSADAVISHAGSGSILTVLRSQPPRPLLVVPNTSLMDNHQAELAEALEEEGYLTTTTVENLAYDLPSWLSRRDVKAFPERDTSAFAGLVDQTMGFV